MAFLYLHFTAHRSANLNIEPLFRNEPLRDQLKLMLLDGLISYCGKGSLPK
ncbi:protein of unknown function [Xenorhabdus poinarii G6]|uniref:Uncharacterized protein n=1 Tax=Xenorhabdus poinarii G6 TaxID=1354304 RepID=A0A068R2Y7_9GAMM|nr:protein of unknown function [Xenorhabdus poinarii G6]